MSVVECFQRITCFKRWSRKKYAVLVSLTKVLKIGVLCMAYSLLNRCSLMAQGDSTTTALKPFEIQEIEVIGRRSQAVFSQVSRIVTVINRDDIEKAGVQYITDLLEYVSNIDIRQRGGFGVQSDASLRGGSFDHVMVLVNGINFSDPQSGHLSLDIPVDPEAIERIEILEGPAARILGPGAFTGALNIVTRQGNTKGVEASQVFGSYGFVRTQADFRAKTGKVGNFLSLSRSASKGYTENTDHLLHNMYYRATLNIDPNLIDFQAGFQQKRFGAAGFYSPRFPDQYEESEVWFASVKAHTGTMIKVTPAFYWRRRKDHYLLKRDDPGFYENFHLTDVYGGQLNLSYGYRNMITTLGLDLRSENILSNNIGYEVDNPRAVRGHDSAYYDKKFARTNVALFGEGNIQHGNLSLSAGMMLNWSNAYPEKPFLFPGLDVSYRILPGAHIYVSFNRALHMPTFTDLFYKDPVNEGNISLVPNKMNSVEGGFRYQRKALTGHLSGFFQSGKGMIDWLWSYSSNRYAPVNLDSYAAWGISANASLNFASVSSWNKWLNSILLNYLFLHIDKSVPDSVSKYNSLRHKFALAVSHPAGKCFSFAWRISYQDRHGEIIGFNPENNTYYTYPYTPYWLIDGSVRWRYRILEVFTEISNLLDTRYVDAGSAEQPGRWLKAGVTVRL